MNDKKLISESVDMLRGWGVLEEEKSFEAFVKRITDRDDSIAMIRQKVSKEYDGIHASQELIDSELFKEIIASKKVADHVKLAVVREYKKYSYDEAIEEGKIANVLLTLTLLGGQSGVALAGIAKDQHSLKKQGIELVQKMQDKGERKVVFKVAKDKAKDAFLKLKKMAGDAGVAVKAGVKEYKSQQSEVAAGHPRIVSGPSGSVGGGKYKI